LGKWGSDPVTNIVFLESILTILYEEGIKLRISGNDLYYTNSLILLVKNMLCDKLHRKEVSFNSLFI